MTKTAASGTRTLLICAALALVTFSVFAPCLKYDFLDYDDQQYVTENSHVQAGLTWQGVAWAFRTYYASNWHPLTWVSHMLDCQWYDLHPAGHHLTNILLHVANTLLLFGLLKRITGSIWPSAMVAALFAWHPLHVESVAWIAERKDVLSAFFWMLTMLAYVHYLAAMCWPRHLAAYYPYPAASSFSSIIASLALLIGITVVAVWLRRRRPEFIVGWLWYVGALVPVIGLVQVGD